MVQGACKLKEFYPLNKVIARIECNIMVDKILVKQQDAICQESQVISCLADGADSTDRRGIVVEPRLRNLTKHNNTGNEINSTNTKVQCTIMMRWSNYALKWSWACPTS